jgi:superfamily II DNA or RNA helicase
MKARKHQIKAISLIENLKDKKLVLGMAPNGGKTITTIIGLNKYLNKNLNHRVLILAHSTNVIKQNFIESLNSFKDYINFSWSEDLYDNSKVHIAIPAQYKDINQKYDFVIVDEAHENYIGTANSKQQMKSIIKNTGAKTELLLTGTPSKFILEGNYDIEIVSLFDIDEKYMSNLSIELVETNYNWKKYYNSNNNVSSKAFENNKAEEALNKIVISIINKIKNDLSPEEFNNIKLISKVRGGFKRIIGDLFENKLKKTLIVCGSIKQAEDVNKIINENSKFTISFVSHHQNDNQSELFQSFKNNDFNVLVVVNRGRLGYSDDNLFNLIDMSGTHNPDLIYQMYARVLRGDKSMNKTFYKLTTQEAGMKDLTYIATSAALMLAHKDYISTFNGKNFNDIRIPVIKKTKTINTKTPSGRSKSKTIDKLYLPGFTNDIINFMKNVISNSDKSTSIYKMTTIADVKRSLSVVDHVYGKGYWTKERCLEEAKKYKTSSEFHIANRTVYQILRDNKWIQDAFPEFVYKEEVPKKITRKMLIDILDKREFDKIHKFYRKYPAYARLLRNLEDSNELKNKYFPGRRILIQKTKKECLQVAKKYTSRWEMEKNDRPYYRKLKSDWPEELNRLFPIKSLV